MEEYVISDGRGTRAVILPEKGATVVSFRQGDREFLYRDEENLASSERPRCGIPFLFPIFGRLKKGKYIWEGREYAMAIHGFAHTSLWKVEAARPDGLTLVLEAEESTLEQYPFRFRVTLDISVKDGTLTIGQTYENRGESPMPYSYGFHPYFSAARPEELQVETGADTLFDFATGPRPFGRGTLSLTLPKGAPETGAALMGVHGPTTLRNVWEGWKLTMEFDGSFHTHVLWAQAGKDFVCVEPVNGTADGLNTGNYLILQPGEKKTAFLRLRAET